MLDVIIIGDGPAGLSAAINARQRALETAVISIDRTSSGLFKASLIDNYPGLPGITGSDLSDKLIAHATESGAQLIAGRVISILPSGGSFYLGYGESVIDAKCVILATGVSQTSLFPGEEKLLGSGVSYCATCDGMLYRGKRVCAVCLAPDADEEVHYLTSIGCDVIRIETQNVTINGDSSVTSVTANGDDIVCSGVFIFRKSVAPHLLLSNLKTENGHISISFECETNIPGVFAAGDCTGTPYQIAKAVGQGQIAALNAAQYISKIK